MKIFTKKVVYGILLGLGLSSSNYVMAQLGVTNNAPNQCYTGSNQVTCSISNTVAGTVSYTWAYAFYPCGTAPAIVGTSSSVVLSLPCAGGYDVTCVALNSSNSPIGGGSTFVFVNVSPTVNIAGTSSLCAGNSTSLVASGANTYTWSNLSTAAAIVVTPTAPTCYTVIGTNSLGCSSSAVHCMSVNITNISISPPSATVCKGSSVDFTASGASTYTWNTSPASNNSTVNVMPMYTTGYTVTGIGSNGCFGGNVVFVTVDTTCSNVWPGDANSDGVVNNSDVFEIGLAYSNTGASRSPGGNTYTSQFANNWLGTVSTGKNKCHADCNGDGTVNNADTIAIYNNYSMTHSFKNAESTSNPDITFTSASALVNEGEWNKVDILLGSTGSPVSQLYGVAFDVNFDNNLIETNSAYIVYTSSFLNASNQNVQFRKGDFTNGKIYAASVRVDGANVSGNGKIGEFWFKAKTGLPANSVINISASNSSKISNSKATTALTGGSTTLTVVKNAVGINENNLERSIQLYPNPASNMLTLQSTENTSVAYSICDIVGRVVAKGSFSNTKQIDLSSYANGTYILRFESEGSIAYKKLVLEK